MMTEVSNFTKTFLQVKVDSAVRSDTGKPNNSPIVLVKPFYRSVHQILLIIHLHFWDNSLGMGKGMSHSGDLFLYGSSFVCVR